MMLASLGACMAGSLFDQTHKLFVPVRHFDWKDLPFDAFGYLAAVVVVFAAYGMAKAWRGGGKARSRPQWRSASGRANIIL